EAEGTLMDGILGLEPVVGRIGIVDEVRIHRIEPHLGHLKSPWGRSVAYLERYHGTALLRVVARSNEQTVQVASFDRRLLTAARATRFSVFHVSMAKTAADLDAEAVWPDPRAQPSFPVDHAEGTRLIEAPRSKEAWMSQHNGHEHAQGQTKGVSRRRILKGAAGLAATTTVPTAWVRRAGAAGKIVVRTIGGAYEEGTVKAIFEPFTKATGIEIVKVPATLGKLLAMVEAGNIELDVVDA